MKMRCGRGCRIWLAGGVLALALAALGMRLFGHLTSTSPDVAAALNKPLPVAVHTVSRGVMEQVLGAEASAGESQLVPIRSSLMTARVVEAHVKLGDIVKQGSLLFRLGSGVQDVAVESARNQLAIDQRDYEAAAKRLKVVQELNAEGLASADEVKVAAKEHSDVARRVQDDLVKVRAASEDQRATVAVAPVTGVLTAGELHPGMVVRAGVDLLTLSAIDPIDVTVKVSEDKVKYARVGQTAEITFYAFPGRVFPGKVVLINPTIENKTRLVSLIVRIDNPKLELTPGMTGVATIKSRREVLRIPAIALVSVKEGSPYVFVVDATNHARLRPVSLGTQGDGFVEVESGLAEGERIVVVGQTALGDNREVRIGTEYAQPK